MTRLLTILSLCLIQVGLFGQNWFADSTTLHFPPTDEKGQSTRKVFIKNHGAEFITVADVEQFTFYDHYPFTVSDSSFSIAPGDSFALQVYFAPEQNLLHRQIVLLKSPSGFGHQAIVLRGQGTYSRSYYRNTRNKIEEPLKTELKTILSSGYQSQGYTKARDEMYGSIDNTGGQVECVYTGRRATFNTRSGANSNSFNTEHTFPQGFFNRNEPMRSDIHHLFPTDVTANSTRGNKPFGVVTNASWNQGGSKSNNSRFEPRDVHKGDVARSMMYFVLRYRDYSNHFRGQEAVLRQWHEQDSVSAKERNRNQDIYNLQKNRSPLIDYPQLEKRISNFTQNSSAPVRFRTYYSDDTLGLLLKPGVYSYRFVMYNDGNQQITLQNFQLNGSGLNFGNGNPGRLTLDPGQHFELAISYDGGRDYQSAFLTLEELQGNTMQSHTFPIRTSINKMSRPELSPVGVWQLAPNPAQSQVTLHGPDTVYQVIMYNAAGVLMLESQGSTWNIAHLPKGLYTVVAYFEKGILRRKLLIE